MKVISAHKRKRAVLRKTGYRRARIVHRGNRKKITGYLLLTLLVVVSIAFLAAYSFQKYFEKSFASAENSNDSYHVSQDDTPVLLYITVKDLKVEPPEITGINYMLFDRNNQKILNYGIPLETSIDMPGKYGEESLSKVFILNNLENPDSDKYAISALKLAVLRYFGFKADNYIIADEKVKNLFDSLLSQGTYLNTVKVWNLIQNRDDFITNLQFNEFKDLMIFSRYLPEERIVYKTADQTYLNNIDLVDEDITDISIDSSISKEMKNVSVLNGTNKSGVANVISRFVKNIGSRVVSVGNTGKYYSESLIIADNKDSPTVSLLARVLNISKVLSKDEALSINESEIDRSDIVIILGFDTVDDLY